MFCSTIFLLSGTVKAVGDRGLRLIELRSLPEGVVFHHWEFLQDHPPIGMVIVLLLFYGCHNSSSFTQR